MSGHAAIVSLGGALVLSTGSAFAMEKFPAKLVEVSKKIVAGGVDGGTFDAGGAEGMPCVPQCTICHNNPRGGDNTATEPFGRKMHFLGLDPQHIDSVEKALRADIDAGTDSDNDGTRDFDELLAGTNPSSPRRDAPLCGPDYGCFARVAPHASHDYEGGGIAVAALLALRAARKRRR